LKTIALIGGLSCAAFITACGQPKSANARNTAREAAVQKWIDDWWGAANFEEFYGRPEPAKPGTVTPAYTLKGHPNSPIAGFRKDLHVKRHVQTQEEYDEERKDKESAAHMRGLITGVRVSGDTVTILTNTTRYSIYDPEDGPEARDICIKLSISAWATTVNGG
jgi:hypothetical protein